MALKTHNKIILGKLGNLCLSPETHGCSHPALPRAGTFPPSLKTASGTSHSEHHGLPRPWGCSRGVLSVLLTPLTLTQSPQRGAVPGQPSPAAMLERAEPRLCGSSNTGQGEASPARLTRCRWLLPLAHLTKKGKKGVCAAAPGLTIPVLGPWVLAGLNTASQDTQRACDAQGDLRARGPFCWFKRGTTQGSTGLKCYR